MKEIYKEGANMHIKIIKYLKLNKLKEEKK